MPVTTGSVTLPFVSSGGEEFVLALLARLVRLETPQDCARAALDWLRGNGSLERGLIALPEDDDRRLRIVAVEGIPNRAIAALSDELNESEHLLMIAFDPPEATRGSRKSERRSESASFQLASYSFHALPLRHPERGAGSALGLMFLDCGPRDIGSEVHWVGDLLRLRLSELECFRLRARADRLERRVRLLDGILHAVPDPIIATDNRGRTLVANRRAESLFTSSETDSEGRQQAVALNNMLFSAAIFTGSDLLGEAPREFLLVDPEEGEDLLFEPLRNRLSEPTSEAGCIVSVLRDITDLKLATHEIEENFRRLKLAEARVRRERDRLDLIINSVADPVLVTDSEGKIALLNAPAERLFSVPASDRSRRAERAVRSNDALLGSFVFKLHTSQALQERGELQLVDPRDGTNVPVEAIAGKVVNDHGELTAIVTTLHDRTDAVEKARLYEQVQQHSEELRARVREATAELAEQNELLRRQAIELERASRMKSQFLANVSHELRTPLNAIMGYTQFMIQGGVGDLTDKQCDRLSRVESNSQQLLTIINDLLDLARIESGNLTVEREEFPVPALLHEVAAELEALIAASPVEVSLHLSPDLPPLESDRQKVKQIMVNFLSNAIKFTRKGSITIVACMDGSDLILSVADTGVGIAPEDHESIFDEFQQVDKSRRHFKGGTGLGLSICRRLAHALGGDIALRSELGKGSTFSLRLSSR